MPEDTVLERLIQAIPSALAAVGLPGTTEALQGIRPDLNPVLQQRMRQARAQAAVRQRDFQRRKFVADRSNKLAERKFKENQLQFDIKNEANPRDLKAVLNQVKKEERFLTQTSRIDADPDLAKQRALATAMLRADINRDPKLGKFAEAAKEAAEDIKDTEAGAFDKEGFLIQDDMVKLFLSKIRESVGSKELMSLSKQGILPEGLQQNIFDTIRKDSIDPNDLLSLLFGFDETARHPQPGARFAPRGRLKVFGPTRLFPEGGS